MRKDWMQLATVVAWALMAFSYTLSPALISISFIIIAVLGLLQVDFKSFNRFETIASLLFVAFYLSSAFSFFNSENTDEAARKLVLKLPLLCLPLLYMAFKNLNKKWLPSMVLVYLYAMYLPAWVSVYNYLINKTLFDQLILESKPLPIEFGYGIYHIQFSILLASSVVLGIYVLIRRIEFSITRLQQMLIGILSAINFIFIHILSARTGLLALYVGLLILLLPVVFKWSFKGKVIAILSACLLPFILFTFSSSLRNRLQNTVSDFEVAWSGKDANDYSFAMRVQAWKNAAQVIKQQPILGVGIGDADKELHDNFARMNSSMTEANRKNPHLQFLENSVQSGLISGILYLCLVFFMVFAKRKPNILISAVLMMLFVASCFESILERQASVVAFAAIIAFAMAFSAQKNEELTL